MSRASNPLPKVAEQSGADAISLVNTFIGLAINIETRKPRIGAGFGGLSGPAIKPLALRLVYEAAKAVTIPVIGLGGIVTGEDAAEFLIAGASAIQVGTGTLIGQTQPCELRINSLKSCGRWARLMLKPYRHFEVLITRSGWPQWDRFSKPDRRH